MAAERGSAFLLKGADGAGGYRTVAGLRTTSAARAAIDVSLSARRRQDVDHVDREVVTHAVEIAAQIVDVVGVRGEQVIPEGAGPVNPVFR